MKKLELGLLVRLEAKAGKEKELSDFLKSALPLVNAEPGTINWYALQIGTSTFGIFDTFENENGLNAHTSGAVAKALGAKAAELLASDPVFEKVELLAFK